MRFQLDAALLAAGCVLILHGDARAQQPAEKTEAAFERAMAAIKTVIAAHGGPADNPKIVDFVAIGGDVATAHLTDGVLKELVGFPHLTRLHLASSGVTDAGLKHVAKLQSLTELVLESTRIGDAGLRELKGLKNLANLNLAGTRISDASIPVLCELPQLSTLKLQNTGVSADGLKKLTDAKSLRHLTYLPVNDRVLKNLNEIGKLSTLHIVTGDPASLTSLNLAFSQVTPAGVKELKLPKLRDLNLRSTPTNDAQLEDLRGLKELRSLNLSSTAVSTAGMKHLKEIKSLESLTLWSTRVDGAGLKELAVLPSLRELSLGQCPINDTDLEILRKFPRLEMISLQKSNITDAGMISLKDCKGLKSIHLNQLDITDTGLNELADLPELTLLVAGVTKATAEGFRPFQKTKSLKTVVVYGNAFRNGATEAVQRLLPGVEVRSFLGRR